MRAIRSGDEVALWDLGAAHTPRLVRYASTLLPGVDHLAEDIVHDALLRAVGSLRKGHRPAEPLPWLYVIVRNASYDVWRRRPPSAAVGNASGKDEPAQDSFEQAAARDELNAVLTELARLPSDQRLALVASTFEGRSYAEIAHQLGTTVSAVRSLINRARRAIRTSVPRPALP